MAAPLFLVPSRGTVGRRSVLDLYLAPARPSRHVVRASMLFLAALGGAANASKIIGAPYGTRTRVTAVKGRCPGPLDEGRHARADTRGLQGEPDI